MADAVNQWQVPPEEDHPGPNQRDSAVLEEAFKGEHRVALEGLWAGDIGDKYRTEAEKELCSILVAYIGEGPRRERAEQIDRLFRRSGLYDPERWTARDRDRTIGPILDVNDHQSSKTKSTPLANEYVVKHGSMFCKQNGTTKIQLANFAAKIAAETVVDDGMQSTRVYTIEATLGGVKSTCSVPAAAFDSMDWIPEELGANAIVGVGRNIRDHLRAAIQKLSGDVPRATTFRHTGWREVDGNLIFLHNGGAIGAENIETDLRSERLERYDFGSSVGDFREAIRHSLRLVKMGNPLVTYPLLSIVYRAPLCHWLPCTVMPHFHGKSGTFKTTIAAAMLSHYGPFPTKETLPGRWLFTSTILEKGAFLAKDVPFVIDDLYPESFRKRRDELEGAFTRILAAVGDNTGKRRATNTLETRPEYYPRGVVVSTGEYTLTLATSRLARLFVIPVNPGDIDVQELTTFQDGLEALPLATRAYIERLRDRFAVIGPEIKHRFAELRSELNTQLGAHRRLSENVAQLQIGMELLVAAKSGAIVAGKKGPVVRLRHG